MIIKIWFYLFYDLFFSTVSPCFTLPLKTVASRDGPLEENPLKIKGLKEILEYFQWIWPQWTQNGAQQRQHRLDTEKPRTTHQTSSHWNSFAYHHSDHTNNTTPVGRLVLRAPYSTTVDPHNTWTTHINCSHNQTVLFFQQLAGLILLVRRKRCIFHNQDNLQVCCHMYICTEEASSLHGLKTTFFIHLHTLE